MGKETTLREVLDVVVEDRLLIWEFRLGSTDALRRIYEKYKNDLLKLAIALTNDVNTAEDIVQDVFVKLAQSAGSIRLAGNLKSYLATCVVNRVRDARRYAHRRGATNLENTGDVVCDENKPERWAILSDELELLGGDG